MPRFNEKKKRAKRIYGYQTCPALPNTIKSPLSQKELTPDGNLNL